MSFEDYLRYTKDLKVAVIGETIIDKWTEVEPQGASSKSACPTALVTGKTVSQLGGAAVIVRHLKDFVGSIDFYTNCHRLHYPMGCITPPQEIYGGVKIRHVIATADDEIEKHRFYQKNQGGCGSKLFEIKTEPKLTVDASFVSKLDQYDLVIVADFGHGLISNDLAKMIVQKIETDPRAWLAAMAQTNSSNTGFNRVSKYAGAHVICMDRTELAILCGQPYTDWKEMTQSLDLGCQFMFITLGQEGSVLIDNRNESVLEKCEAFATENVVDTIGAGDAFFAFAALAPFVPQKYWLSVPSTAAALNCTWLCNSEAITPESLKNAYHIAINGVLAGSKEWTHHGWLEDQEERS